MPIWVVFLAWASFFFVGGGIAGWVRSVSSNLVGVVIASASLYAAHLMGGSLLVTAIAVGVGSAVMVQASWVPLLSTTPGRRRRIRVHRVDGRGNRQRHHRHHHLPPRPGRRGRLRARRVLRIALGVRRHRDDEDIREPDPVDRRKPRLMKLQHYLGGLEGLPEPLTLEKRVFVEEWEKRIFGIHVAMMGLSNHLGAALPAYPIDEVPTTFKDEWTWADLRTGAEAMNPFDYFKFRYYEKWLGGITQFFIDKGYVTEEELADRIAELPSAPDRFRLQRRSTIR